jgi:hypothetical protein
MLPPLSSFILKVIEATFAELPGTSDNIDLAAYSSLVESHPMMLSQLTLNVNSLVAEHTTVQ